MAKKDTTHAFDKPVDGFPHVKDNGGKRATIANFRHLLKSYNITVSYDEVLKDQVMILNNNYDNGHDDLKANSNIAHVLSLLALNGLPKNTMDMLPAIFSESSKNPIMDWMKSTPWDKQDRIIELADTITVAECDVEYVYLALRTWLIQTVAAADGAKNTPNKNAIPKYELVFVLQGGQGVQKTSWFLRLLPKDYSQYIVDGMHLDPANIDSVRQACSSLICELGELDSTFKKEASRLKAFFSKRVDIMRLPYDKAASNLSRRTSFCGSVNPKMFYVDETGNRRFLPVQALTCNHLHNIDMQQLWAQVYSLYLDGEQWWCNDELEGYLVERHNRHAQSNPLHDLINEHFDLEQVKKHVHHKHYTPTRVLLECGIKEPKQVQATTCTTYLEDAGFTRTKNNGIVGFWLAKRPGFITP